MIERFEKESRFHKFGWSKKPRMFEDFPLITPYLSKEIIPPRPTLPNPNLRVLKKIFHKHQIVRIKLVIGNLS